MNKAAAAWRRRLFVIALCPSLVVAGWMTTVPPALGASPPSGWTPLSLGSNMVPVGGTCVDATHCWTAGAVTSNGITEAGVAFSDDTGKTWTRQTAQPGVGDFTAIDCVSDSRCVAVGGPNPDGSGTIFVTTDGGATWQQHVAPVPYPQFPQWLTVLTSVSCQGVACVAGGYAAVPQNNGGGGGGTSPVVLYTRDGNTWSVGAPPAGYAVTVSCPGPQTCVAVSESNTIDRSTDGGATWPAVDVEPAPRGSAGGTLWTISCAPGTAFCAALGEAVSTSNANPGPPITRISHDAGGTWAPGGPTPGGIAIYLSCPDAYHCQAGGSGPGQTSDLWATNDGGSTWRSEWPPAFPRNENHPYALFSPHCLSSQVCMIFDEELSGGWRSVSAGTFPGYRLITADGGIFAFGAAPYEGSAPDHPNAPVHIGGCTTSRCANPAVGLVATTDGAGYWIIARDGSVLPLGDAATIYGTAGKPTAAPVVGGAATPDDSGLWLAGADGGVLTFGDAAFHGSTGDVHLAQPVVGIAATPDGQGYWLVARDGGIFTFGDAHFFGSTGAIHLNQPIVGMSVTPDGQGYWLVARDGGIFTFGDAHFYGSTGGMHLNAPILGMSAPDSAGYQLVASDGGIFTFGDAHFYGSTGAIHLNQPVVGMG